MNGQVEFEWGAYIYVVEYTAFVEYDEGTHDTPPYLDWDVMVDDITIARFDEDGKEEYISAHTLDLEFMKIIWAYIENDIKLTFEY